MFSRLVVPVDLGGQCGRAVELASGIARRGGSTLHLVHVVEEVPGLLAEELREFYARLEARAADRLGACAEALAEQGFTVRCHIVHGDVAREIVACAEQNAADLIVLSSHVIDPRDPTRGWSTVSYKVSLLARCPVLLVKELRAAVPG